MQTFLPSPTALPPCGVTTNLLFCSLPETIESTNVTPARLYLTGKRWGLPFKTGEEPKADFFFSDKNHLLKSRQDKKKKGCLKVLKKRVEEEKG